MLNLTHERALHMSAFLCCIARAKQTRQKIFQKQKKQHHENYLKRVHQLTVTVLNSVKWPINSREENKHIVVKDLRSGTEMRKYTPCSVPVLCMSIDNINIAVMFALKMLIMENE